MIVCAQNDITFGHRYDVQNRLYTQLEVLKNKTLRQDNPHISKRRGGRKPAHRRFSLQVNIKWSDKS